MSEQNNLQNHLLEQIQKSMADMQQQMQNTYTGLQNVHAKGEYEGVTILLSCTYSLIDIDFLPQAMKGGATEFKHRLRQAWSIACEEVQKMTQAKTMELLQGMNIPEEIRNMSMGQLTDKNKDKE